MIKAAQRSDSKESTSVPTLLYLFRLELDMLKNMPPEYKYASFETSLGLYIRVCVHHLNL